MTVTGVAGFKAIGIHGGIKPEDKLDLTYIGSLDNKPVMAAGVFTSNKLCAAPVTLTREHLAKSGGNLVGVIINSGNANAATGETGYINASKMAKAVSSTLNIDVSQVGVCSTGLIGYQLPIENIVNSIPQAIKESSVDGGELASKAIMTTDTLEKTFLKKYTDKNGTEFTLGAIAKGAAMLQPNMATMLGFITTDASVKLSDLQSSLSSAVGRSFNKLTVDGAQSTNDTVLVFSSAKTDEINIDDFADAMLEVCQSLAKQMCDDAEGSTHTVCINVIGAKNDDEANHGARRVANCQLVKCSWFGNDPYWGRVASELGASSIDYDFTKLSISYGDHIVLKNGESIIDNYSDEQREKIREYMKNREIVLNVDLGVGYGTGWIWTNDLTFGYIEENMGTS
ncbi:MAG: bifunctional glutamate N-acetyltransferase/amino-acid acetyltransferase ArgJ [Acidimicrobiia bacterium]|nr:bifunctional glutamate N-acetyltransferase/amino-acid acetyltransferase ArgJ [Acidimicrobiia bacterium]